MTTRPAAAPSDLLSSLAADAAYLGLSSTLVAVSGWPLLSTPGALAAARAGEAAPTARTPTPAFIFTSILSFLPLINWAAWLLLMVTEGPKPRYWVFSAAYAFPFVAAAVGGGEVMALEAAAVCALHFQVERLALAAADNRRRGGAAGAGGGASVADACEQLAQIDAALAEAAEAEMEAWDARLGARTARAHGCAGVGVPRARSARVGEVAAALEAAVLGASEGGADGAVRAELVADVRAALIEGGAKGAAGEEGGRALAPVPARVEFSAGVRGLSRNVMHPSTPRQRRPHVHAPVSAASLLHRAAAASAATTTRQRLAATVILALFLIWNAFSGEGDGRTDSVSAIAAIGLAQHQTAAADEFFHPGEPWLDTAGAPIQAHGGCIVRDPDTGAYFWYGEDKSGGPTRVVGGDPGSPGSGTARVDVTGIAVYSAPALAGPWTRVGLALDPRGSGTAATAGGPGAAGRSHHPDLDPKTGVLERPAVIRRPAHGTLPPSAKKVGGGKGGGAEWVMWAHVDSEDYSAARIGVAVSTAGPAGPFAYQGSFRPGGAHEARDLTLFQDEDGAAYVFYSSEGNRVMHVSRLTPDYRSVSPDPAHSARALVDLGREAPAVFRCGEWVYVLTSGCTGWAANAAEAFAARHPLGEWVSLGRPAAGGTPGARARTFHSQPAAVVPVPPAGAVPAPSSPSSPSSSALLWPPPRPDGACAFVYAGDQWNTDDLGASRYVWLPLWVVPDPRRPGGGGAGNAAIPPRKAAPGAAAAARRKGGGGGAATAAGAVTTPSPPHPGTAVILPWAAAWSLADLRVPPPVSVLPAGGPSRVVEI